MNKVNGILNNRYPTIESWRIPYSYDAALALLTAASNTNQQSSPQSSQIKNLLHNLNITGATGQIQFDGKGDRKQDNNSDNIELFRVVKNANQCSFQRL